MSKKWYERDELTDEDERVVARVLQWAGDTMPIMNDDDIESMVRRERENLRRVKAALLRIKREESCDEFPEREALAKHALPPLPEGAVYLGMGGSFKIDGTRFVGWAYNETAACLGWQANNDWGGYYHDFHYAVPADSEIARLNGLGEEPEYKSDMVGGKEAEDGFVNPAAEWLTEEEVVEIAHKLAPYSLNAANYTKIASELLTRKYGSPADTVPVGPLIKALSCEDSYGDSVLSKDLVYPTGIKATRAALAALHPKLKAAIEGGEG